MIFRSPFRDITIPEVPLTQFTLQYAGERANHVAMIEGPSGRTVTYAQLAGGARLMAAGLSRRGFQKGDVFAIFLPNLPEYAIALFGAASAGGNVTVVSSPSGTGRISKRSTRSQNNIRAHPWPMFSKPASKS
ncbi:MAG: AMP-binding protein [Chloroflexi bacterium]|nr:AMP-binding protein [Chloroflexota bacterium]